MSFLGIDDLPSSSPILSDDQSEDWTTIGELKQLSQLWDDNLEAQRSIVFLYIQNSILGVAQLLASLKNNHVVALLDPNLPIRSKQELHNIYKPRFIFDENKLTVSTIKSDLELHPDLSVLLSTSGSTGSPKFVKLTQRNIESNAKSICEVLDIRTSEVGCGHLPLHYSYGLSVLTSHIFKGAPVHLTSKGFLDDSFWKQMKYWKIAHLPGVPFHYLMLKRFGFSKVDLPNLRVLTQAGGALDSRIKKNAHDFMNERNGKFHVMYGQTEASPRLTTLSHEDFSTNPNSVGVAMPGAKLEIHNDEGKVDTGVEGNIMYFGKNVMMGYAENSLDLAEGDLLNGVLDTGDIGFLDKDNRLTITGRSKRIGKIAGLRINLDEVENCLLKEYGEIAVIQESDNLIIFYVKPKEQEKIKDNALELLMNTFSLSKVTYKFKEITHIPRTNRNKTDYSSLKKFI